MTPASQTAEQVLDRWRERIMAVRSAEDGLAILTGLAAEQARDGANLVFLKVSGMTGKEGWTYEDGDLLADAWVHGHLGCIVETMVAFNGTREMTEAMIDAAVDAFGERLRELAGSFGAGGSA